MKALLYSLLMKLPHLDIVKTVPKADGLGTEEVLYLRRFFLFRSKWLKKVGINKDFGNLYLHHIVRSDEDPDPHDHPWNFTSLILWGGYLDEQWEWEGDWAGGSRCRIYDIRQNLRPGKVVRRSAWHLHRVRLYTQGKQKYLAEPGEPCRAAWTLVKTGRYERDWTFVKADGPVLWWDYLGIPKPANVTEDIG